MINGRCCVFQPFDKGAHDKRYEDTIAPAIRKAGLEPYRVDRDDGAVIPIETLQDEIRSSIVCLADISTRNPNVMYELGFAIASGKSVVIICSVQQSEKFPFNIQHRGVIQYASDSASDFRRLQEDVTNRLQILMEKQATTLTLAAASPVKTTEGLRPHEVASLVLVMTNAGYVARGASAYSVKTDMEQAGYTSVAAQLGLIRLSRIGLVEALEDEDQQSGEVYLSYRLTTAGQDWLLENQEKLQTRLSEDSLNQQKFPFEPKLAEDDVPF